MNIIVSVMVQWYRQYNNSSLCSSKDVKFSSSQLVSWLSTPPMSLDLILFLFPPFLAVNWWFSFIFEAIVSDNKARSSVVRLKEPVSGSVDILSLGSSSTAIFVAAFSSFSFVAFS